MDSRSITMKEASFHAVEYSRRLSGKKVRRRREGVTVKKAKHWYILYYCSKVPLWMNTSLELQNYCIGMGMDGMENVLSEENSALMSVVCKCMQSQLVSSMTTTTMNVCVV